MVESKHLLILYLQDLGLIFQIYINVHSHIHAGMWTEIFYSSLADQVWLYSMT